MSEDKAKAQINVQDKATLKKTAVFAAVCAVVFIGVALAAFTCCTESSITPSDLTSMKWETYLKDGHFVKSGSSYDCDWTAMDVRGSGSSYIVKLFTGNDSVEYAMDVNGSDGTIYAKYGGGGEQIAVRLSDKLN